MSKLLNRSKLRFLFLLLITLVVNNSAEAKEKDKNVAKETHVNGLIEKNAVANGIAAPALIPMESDVSVKKMQKKAVFMYLNNIGYYLYKGKFYQSTPWGFYRIHPPKYVFELPDGAIQHWHKGKRKFYYYGVEFKETSKGYKIDV